MAVDPKIQEVKDDTPQKVRFGDAPPPIGGDSSMKTRLVNMLMIVGFAIVVCFLMTQFYFKPVGMDLYNTNLENMTKLVTEVNNKVTADEKTFDTLSKTEFPALTKAFNDLKATVKPENYATKAEVQAVQSSINNLANNLAVTNIQNDVNTVKGQVKAVADANTLQDTKLTKLEADLKTAQEQLKLTQEQVKALQATPTPTTNPTTGVGLVATIIPSIFGNTSMVYPVAISTTAQSYSNSFQFQIANNTNKTANAIQMLVGFQVMNSAGTVPTALPTGTTATLNMQGYVGVWTQQTGGDPSQLVFSNSQGTGVFASIYNLSQVAGSQAYNMYLTLNMPAMTAPVIYSVIPIVKMVSYTN